MSSQEIRATSYDFLLNVRLKVTAELGSCEMTIADLMRVGNGSIIELDRRAGDPVDLLVNDKVVARGEIIAVDDHFGLRVTEVNAVQ